MVRKIIVVPHDPTWPMLFQKEANWLSFIFGNQIIAIHHFGSTALPDIYAKPIIDILVEVRDLDLIDQANDCMREFGYLPKGEFGIPGRRFFIKGDEDNRTHHIHFYLAGHPEVKRHLDFRDYMLAHPKEAEAYSRLKIELAHRFPEDIDGYNAGKDGFVKEIDRKARIWNLSGRTQHLSKTALIERIEIASQALIQFVSHLPEDELDRPGVLGDWSIKDIFVHINFWQAFLLNQVRAILRNQAVPEHEADVDSVNAQVVASSQRLVWQKVIVEFRRLVNEMIEIIDELPEADLSIPGRYWVISQEPLWCSIASETYEHYAEHLDHIRAWSSAREEQKLANIENP